VIITGGRTYHLTPHDEAQLDGLGITKVYTGGQTGADAGGKQWAIRRGIPHVESKVTKAHRDRYGAKAYPMRNGAQVKKLITEARGARIACVAFPVGAGTADQVRQAREQGIEIITIDTRELFTPLPRVEKEGRQEGLSRCGDCGQLVLVST